MMARMATLYQSQVAIVLRAFGITLEEMLQFHIVKLHTPEVQLKNTLSILTITMTGKSPVWMTLAISTLAYSLTRINNHELF